MCKKTEDDDECAKTKEITKDHNNHINIYQICKNTENKNRGRQKYTFTGSAPDPVLLASVLDLPHTPVSLSLLHITC